MCVWPLPGGIFLSKVAQSRGRLNRYPRGMVRRLFAVCGFSLVMLLLSISGVGCASTVAADIRYGYFDAPAEQDAWSSKIAGWQRRSLRQEAVLESAPLPPVSKAAEIGPSASQEAGEAQLREKYFDFRAERKRALARDVAIWVQAQAPIHYVEDGVIDHWATLEETLEANGDDCDGLELLTFHALRDLGFDRLEVYRAVIHRPMDGQHHMVTLWFEDPEDPWVIDPTGAMTLGMPRMSEFPGWVPIKLFTDTVEFTVHASVPGPETQLAAND